ncbi:sigma-70 family RNA polymerase sigma factor [Agathobaculum sp.]|uniref:sigma-70 family RNA polymerase sigma factor n=1 Tax=Agathobaculum sp. TaxID=2048138 RepID=UPI002A82FFBB|nr:sigma-70 family RNA polymerase sigma factor [Agathobaculum sp.]MDY3618295.1 sigma-70 family RNA polymerase sigma factor [Agathobaculum sp.]
MQQAQFEELARRYRDNLFAIAFQYTRNAADAEDMTQIALMKCYKAEKPFENEEHARNWLIRVTINECKRYLTSPWRRLTAPIDDYAQTLGFESPEQSELFLAVMKLPQKYRVCIHLYYYEDYSVREVAQMLGLRESAVQTRLMRARQKLKSTLEGWNDD